jgi:hypothetical protein
MIEKVYTREEILSMKRGPSLYPPIIVNFISGRSMIFHDEGGGTIRIADDVTPDDTQVIWVRLPENRETVAFKGEAQYEIPGSKGLPYTVTLNRGQWTCSCPGFGFRRRCRHVDEAKIMHTKNVNNF